MAQETHIIDLEEMTELREAQESLLKALQATEHGEAEIILRKGLHQLHRAQHQDARILMKIGEKLWQ
tara:strand:+ start:309 stop:509 length:201 start_codon:yes stop_codon:yes gene_type:complete